MTYSLETMTNVSDTCGFRTNYSCWNEVVDSLNLKWSRLVVPVEMMMCGFMIVGAIGNGIVLLVYSCRKQKTTAIIFAMFLACIDIFSCLVIHPYVIYKLFNNYDQTWSIACKIFEFFVHFNLSLSGLALLLIAIDRFLAICRPIKFLLFRQHVVKALVTITIVAAVISVPLFEFYGASPLEIHVINSTVTGYKCHYRKKYLNSTSLMAFGTFIMSGFIVEIIAMAVLYKHVAVTAYRSSRAVCPLSNAYSLAGINHPTTSNSKAQTTSGTMHDTELPTLSPSEGPLRDALNCEEVQCNTKNTSFDTGRAGISAMCLTKSIVHTDCVTSRTHIPTHTHAQSYGTIRSATANRHFESRLKASKMLFSVTVVFFLSWMPFFIMRLCVTLDPDYWNDQSDSRLVIESLLNHVYYLNNAANPIIYTIINKNFRHDCRIVFMKHCRLIKNNAGE